MKVTREEFNNIVRDCLRHINNPAVLETHPFSQLFIKPDEYINNQFTYIYHFLTEVLDELKPVGVNQHDISPEWRPYLVLRGRYFDNIPEYKLTQKLSISDRQLRREVNHGVKAFNALLWDRFQNLPDHTNFPSDRTQTVDKISKVDFLNYQVRWENLDIIDVIDGVVGTLANRIEKMGIDVNLSVQKDKLPAIQSDRIIIRQVILSIFNNIFERPSTKTILIRGDILSKRIILIINFEHLTEIAPADLAKEASNDFINQFTNSLDFTIDVKSTPSNDGFSTEYLINLPRGDREILLVIDDQLPAIQLFRRYLSLYNIKVIGTQNPENALKLVNELQPKVVCLDVMMPNFDGWEILQTLKADPDTKHVQVIICSVWDNPDLAYSLGAAGYLKKPISQIDFITELTRLNLLNNQV